MTILCINAIVAGRINDHFRSLLFNENDGEGDFSGGVNGDGNDSGGDDDDETAPRLICIPGEPFIQWESLHCSDWSCHHFIIIMSSCHHVIMSSLHHVIMLSYHHVIMSPCLDSPM